MASYKGSYISRMRAHVGHALIVSPGAQLLGIRATDGHVLLQKRADTRVWEIPAGACEPGQSFRETAAVEFLEETGIAVAPDDLFAIGSLSEAATHTLHYPNGDIVRAYALLFAVELTGSEAFGLHTDGEAVSFGWFDPAELPAPLHAPTQRVLDLYKKFEETGAFQAY